MNKNQVFGLITITVIVGGTIYAIRKHKNSQLENEEVISLEEARELVKAGRDSDKQSSETEPRYTEEEVDELIRDAKNRMNSPIILESHMQEVKEEARFEAAVSSFEKARISAEEMGELVDDCRDEASWNASFSTTYEGEKEEDNVLRYEPNSDEALRQFINMELADWNCDDFSRRKLNELFDYSFVPNTDGDRLTMIQIENYRTQFFGPQSVWNNKVTIADIILHYARVTDYNVGKGVRYWAEHFLEVSGLDDCQSVGETEEVIEAFNSHNYYNEVINTHGIFGLTDAQLDEAIDVAGRHVDGKLTYEIEFNTFLKGV